MKNKKKKSIEMNYNVSRSTWREREVIKSEYELKFDQKDELKLSYYIILFFVDK